MSENETPDSGDPGPAGTVDADDQLPPVSPPTAGFLMQLFIVPMVIVIIIVMVCLMFNWLAHLGTRPEDLVDDLERLNPGSWQKALTIANYLCDPNQSELRQNQLMADRLAEVLDKQMEVGAMSDEQIQLRVYLCRALGVFEVDNGMPALITAASTQRDPKELEVRLAALEALATLADGVPDGKKLMRGNPKLIKTIDAAAREFDETGLEKQANAELRQRAAYALGVIGGEQCQDTLAKMTSDPEWAVRFNAATGLARNGDARGVDQLIAMLRPADLTGVDGQPLDPATSFSIVRNGLRAIMQLNDVNSTADLSALQVAVQQLVDKDPQGAIGVDAKVTLQALKARNVATLRRNAKQNVCCARAMKRSRCADWPVGEAA
ncbi:MAG: HEAT repeat domain-containing protein [Pirellulaceae bacterium]|nr:HEAT repeat domain-containing protein [Pirellulaceae bacterium]